MGRPVPPAKQGQVSVAQVCGRYEATGDGQQDGLTALFWPDRLRDGCPGAYGKAFRQLDIIKRDRLSGLHPALNNSVPQETYGAMAGMVLEPHGDATDIKASYAFTDELAGLERALGHSGNTYCRT